jgi:hypothetical protein
MENTIIKQSQGFAIKTFEAAVIKLRELGLLPTWAVVEYYPIRDWLLYSQGRTSVFAYQFMDDGERNIATFIPDVESLVTQPGGDGKGRVYGFPIVEKVRVYG